MKEKPENWNLQHQTALNYPAGEDKLVCDFLKFFRKYVILIMWVTLCQYVE